MSQLQASSRPEASTPHSRAAGHPTDAAEARLAELYERFRSVLENSLDAAYRRELRTDTYDYVSPVMETVLGVRLEWLRTAPIDAVLARIHPDDRHAVVTAVAAGRRAGRARVEHRFLTDAGEYRWVADHFTVQTDELGRPLFRTGIVRDITEQKLDEQALR